MCSSDLILPAHSRSPVRRPPMNIAIRRSLTIALAVCLTAGGVPVAVWAAPPAKPGLGGLHFFSRSKSNKPAVDPPATSRGGQGFAPIREKPVTNSGGTTAKASANPIKRAFDRVAGKAPPQVGHALPASTSPTDSTPLRETPQPQASQPQSGSRPPGKIPPMPAGDHEIGRAHV